MIKELGGINLALIAIKSIYNVCFWKTNYSEIETKLQKKYHQ